MIGIDLHKRESQLCTLAVDGTITEQRIVTSRDRFVAVSAIEHPHGFSSKPAPRVSGSRSVSRRSDTR